SRRKIAKAFIDVCTIRIEGGCTSFYTVWLKCPECNVSYLQISEGTNACPLCGFIEHSENKKTS
ncbi:MAG: DNA-binding protein, partial [Bacillota bacterium]|nr:DNA-binding protein [Bacillota bacterium]